jgi:CMP-N-acetylneuraminic acid synthetase
MAAVAPVAIITARGGSKGLPRKNLLPLKGKPLICHTIDAALHCPSVRGVFVSTEDEEIAQASVRAGARVIPRPRDLAADNSTSRDVILHALDWLEAEKEPADTFALLQPTSPLRTAKHLDECIGAFFSDSYGCAISVCEAEHHPARFLTIDAKGCLAAFGAESDLNKPRQQLSPAYRQNGAIYLMRSDDFRTKATGFFLAPAMPFVMSQRDSVDIDTALDFRIAEMLLESAA